jgi:hypothetical protein
MFILPLASEDHQEDSLIIVLEAENLERMRQGDPAFVEMKQIRKSGTVLVDPTVLVCYEEKRDGELERLLQGDDMKACLDYLFRGWHGRPQAEANHR